MVVLSDAHATWRHSLLRARSNPFTVSLRLVDSVLRLSITVGLNLPAEGIDLIAISRCLF